MKYELIEGDTKISHGVPIAHIKVCMPSGPYKMDMWMTPYGVHSCEDEAYRVIRRLWRWAGNADGVHKLTQHTLFDSMVGLVVGDGQ